jgi:PD-(D/E)XK nuclease superfamily
MHPDLAGSLDLVEQHPAGGFAVVDLKTAARKYSDLQVEASLQLSIYRYPTAMNGLADEGDLRLLSFLGQNPRPDEPAVDPSALRSGGGIASSLGPRVRPPRPARSSSGSTRPEVPPIVRTVEGLTEGSKGRGGSPTENPLALLMDGVKVGDVPRRAPRSRPQRPARWAVPVGGSGPSQWNEPLKWSASGYPRLVPRSRPLHHRAGEHEGKRFRPKTVELSPGSTPWRHGDLRPLRLTRTGPRDQS